MRVLAAIAVITACFHSSGSAAPDCEGKEKDALSIGAFIPGYDAIREVVGTGRLGFYSAPNLLCKMPGIFILPGERVIAYVEHNGYTSVMYISKINDYVTGWVESRRLKPTGEGISPHYKND